MGGDPDLITEEMRPVNAQSFGLIYTSPLMLLTHRLATDEFWRRRGRRVNGLPIWSLYVWAQEKYNRSVPKLLHKSALMMLHCLGSGKKKVLAGKIKTMHHLGQLWQQFIMTHIYVCSKWTTSHGWPDVILTAEREAVRWSNIKTDPVRIVRRNQTSAGLSPRRPLFMSNVKPKVSYNLVILT